MGLLVVGLVTESSLVGEGLVVKTSLAEVGLLAEACLNHSIALRACIPLKPEDKGVEKRLLPVLRRRL